MLLKFASILALFTFAFSFANAQEQDIAKMLESAFEERIVVISDEMYNQLRTVVQTSEDYSSAQKKSGSLSLSGLLGALSFGAKGKKASEDWQAWKKEFLNTSAEEVKRQSVFIQYERTLNIQVIELLKQWIHRPGFYAWVESQGEKVCVLVMKYIAVEGAPSTIKVLVTMGPQKSVEGQANQTVDVGAQGTPIIIERANNDELAIALQPSRGKAGSCYFPPIRTKEERQQTDLEKRIEYLEKMMVWEDMDLEDTTSFDPINYEYRWMPHDDWFFYPIAINSDMLVSDISASAFYFGTIFASNKKNGTIQKMEMLSKK